jgi:hypothetical protein
VKNIFKEKTRKNIKKSSKPMFFKRRRLILHSSAVFRGRCGFVG